MWSALFLRRKALLGISLLLLLVEPRLARAGDRQPVRGVPIICGRKIPQFVLLHPVDFTPSVFSIDSVHAFPNGLFVPVSEDEKGVYFQATNGVIVGLAYPPYHHTNEDGGIYCFKTKPGLAYACVRDARKPGEDLIVMAGKLRKEVLEKFLIGQPAPARAKKKSQ